LDEGRTTRYRFSVVRDRLHSHPAPYLDFVFGRHRVQLPESVREIVRKHGELALRRCTREEAETFAQTAVESLSRSYGVEKSPAAILPTPGGRAGLSAIAATLISPGQTVVVTEPGYPVFDRVAAQAHAAVRSITLDPGLDFEPDLDPVTGERAGAVRILALNYPNNPTGTVPSPAAIAGMRGRLDGDTIWFNDATYGPLTFADRPFSLLATESARRDEIRTLELHSLAKLFPLGPLSASFLTGDDDLVDAVREYSDFAWSPMSALQLRVAGECLRRDDHVAALRDDLRERVSRLGDVLGELGFDCFPVRGGMYQLCRAPAEVDGQRVDGADEAAEALLANHHLAVMPFQVADQAYVRFSALYLPEELESLAGLGRGRRLVQS
jgi:aspartate/methionine/tyrosine aminotransferase